MYVAVALLALVAIGVIALGVTTGIGATKRGARAPWAVVAGLLYPITWIVWYLRDERPRRTPA